MGEHRTDSVRFDGQVVIVTGAARGLGRAYALELAQRGASVVANDLPEDGPGMSLVDELVGEIERSGGLAVPAYASVATPEGGLAIVERALERFGTVDAVINNAGVLRHALFRDLTLDQLDAVIDTHLRAAFYVTQPAWKVMAEKRYGRIVLTSSPAGAFGKEGMSNYGAAKAAMIGLAKVLSLEGREVGIRTNAVLPNARTTARVGDAAPVGSDNDRVFAAWEQLSGRTEPERVAALTVYLASRDCALCGEAVSVVGGRYARVFVGATRGWSSGDSVATPEDIRQHLPEIVDEAGYLVPDSLAAEYEAVAAALQP